MGLERAAVGEVGVALGGYGGDGGVHFFCFGGLGGEGGGVVGLFLGEDFQVAAAEVLVLCYLCVSIGWLSHSATGRYLAARQR